jgi:glycogen synthase
MTKERAEWLAGLKVGDEVALVTATREWSIGRVSHARKSLVVVAANWGGGLRFSRKTGSRMPRGTYGVTMQPVTPTARENAERTALEIYFRQTDWSKVPVDAMRAARSIVSDAIVVQAEAKR